MLSLLLLAGPLGLSAADYGPFCTTTQPNTAQQIIKSIGNKYFVQMHQGSQHHNDGTPTTGSPNCFKYSTDGNVVTYAEYWWNDRKAMCGAGKGGECGNPTYNQPYSQIRNLAGEHWVHFDTEISQADAVFGYPRMCVHVGGPQNPNDVDIMINQRPYGDNCTLQGVELIYEGYVPGDSGSTYRAFRQPRSVHPEKWTINRCNSRWSGSIEMNAFLKFFCDQSRFGTNAMSDSFIIKHFKVITEHPVGKPNGGRFKIHSLTVPNLNLVVAASQLTATPVSPSQINLGWSDNANNETAYWLERKTGAGGAWTRIATLGPNTTGYNDTGLAGPNTYYYRVAAANSGGASSWSNEAQAAIGEPAQTPAAPSALAATAVTASRIDLAWTDNATNETGFKIERKTGATGAWSEIATVGANVTGFASQGLAPGTEYYHRVRAYNAGGNSPYSNEAAATTEPLSGNLVFADNFDNYTSPAGPPLAQIGSWQKQGWDKGGAFQTVPDSGNRFGAGTANGLLEVPADIAWSANFASVSALGSISFRMFQSGTARHQFGVGQGNVLFINGNISGSDASFMPETTGAYPLDTPVNVNILWNQTGDPVTSNGITVDGQTCEVWVDGVLNATGTYSASGTLGSSPLWTPSYYGPYWLDDLKMDTGFVVQGLSVPGETRFTGWAWQPDGLHLSLSVPVDQSYVLEAAANFLPPVTWQPVATNTASGGVVDFLDPEATNHPQRYYRAVAP